MCYRSSIVLAMKKSIRCLDNLLVRNKDIKEAQEFLSEMKRLVRQNGKVKFNRKKWQISFFQSKVNEDESYESRNSSTSLSSSVSGSTSFVNESDYSISMNYEDKDKDSLSDLEARISNAKRSSEKYLSHHQRRHGDVRSGHHLEETDMDDLSYKESKEDKMIKKSLNNNLKKRIPLKTVPNMDESDVRDTIINNKISGHSRKGKSLTKGSMKNQNPKQLLKKKPVLFWVDLDGRADDLPMATPADYFAQRFYRRESGIEEKRETEQDRDLHNHIEEEESQIHKDIHAYDNDPSAVFRDWQPVQHPLSPGFKHGGIVIEIEGETSYQKE